MLAFTNIRLFDGVADELQEGLNVLVQEGRISGVPAAETPLPAGCETVDGGGAVLMPGLIDAHVHAYAADINLRRNDQQPTTLLAHHAARRLEAMLQQGFTTVRDCGGADIGLARALEHGLIPGPRLLYCGRIISQRGGHGDFRPPDEHDHEDCWTCGCTAYGGHLSVTADGVDEVRKAVRDNLRRGGSFIKFAASGGVSSTSSPLDAIQYSDEEVRAIIDEVERFGTYCTAHIHPDAAIRRAVELGVHCVEHASMISRETAELAAGRGTHVVPTLSIGAALQREGPALGYAQASLDKLEMVMERILTGLGEVRAAGMRAGFGTDLLGDLEKYRHLEFELRAEVYSNLEILRQLTSDNAVILGMAGEIGVVRTGAAADLLLVDGNPIEDLSLLYRPGGIKGIYRVGERIEC